MPRLLYLREWHSAHYVGGWVSTRAGLDGCRRAHPHQDSIPGPSSPKQVTVLTVLSGSTMKINITPQCNRQGLAYLSNKTPTRCNTVQVLFLQSHSTCFGRKRPSSGVFKTSTAATVTCVIVAGKS